MASIPTTTGSKSAMGTTTKSGKNQARMSKLDRVGPSRKNVRAKRDAKGSGSGQVPTGMIGRSITGPDLGDG